MVNWKQVVVLGIYVAGALASMALTPNNEAIAYLLAGAAANLGGNILAVNSKQQQQQQQKEEKK